MAAAKKVPPASTKLESAVPSSGPTDKSRGVWKWLEDQKEVRWTTPLIPNGDVCVARVQRSLSKGIHGKYSFYAYRSAKLLGMRDTPEEAQKLCQTGKSDPRRDNVTAYVDTHPGEIPAFLALTEDERRAVRAQYPYAAPRERAAERAARRGAPDMTDPSTVRFAEQLRRNEARAKGAEEGTGITTRGGRKVAESNPEAELEAVPGAANPGRPGSSRHAKYQAILDGAAAGSTVAQLTAAGADVLRIGKCISKGLVRIKGGI